MPAINASMADAWGPHDNWEFMCNREVTDHPKALFRRATANAALMNYEAAREDFEQCKQVCPVMAKDVDRCVLISIDLLPESSFESTQWQGPRQL